MFQLRPNTILDGVCTIAVVLVALYNYYCIKTNKKGTGYSFFVVFILLYSLFYRPLGGDFWNYLSTYQIGIYAKSNMEGFYFWLMRMIPNNYLLWRMAIWLPTAIFIAMVFKIIKAPNSIVTTVFLVFGLHAYYYTRNTLALSILYLGIALFCLRNKSKSNVVLFACLAFSSWFFHKSMPMYIGIALVSLVIPFNKQVFMGFLIAFPFLYRTIMLLGSNFINMTALWSTEGAGSYYLEAASVNYVYNWKGIIYFIISYAPVIYFYFISLSKPISKDDLDFPAFKVFLFFSFLVIYLSFLFYEQGSLSIQRRLYTSAMIPFAYVVALYFKHYMGSKQCTMFIYLTWFSILGTQFLSFLTSM